MKNKFEALKAFMSWPRDWQELCAEFWASDDEPDQQRFAAADLAIAPVRDCIDQGEMKLGPMPVRRAAAKKTKSQYGSRSWSIAESEYLVKCVSEHTGKLCYAVNKFLDKYPGRSADAVRRRAWGMRSGELSSEVKY